LLDCVNRLLRYDGRFALIIPENQAATVIELAGARGLFPSRRLNVKPTETKPVNRVVMELSRTSQPPEEMSLTVRIDNHYSNDYKSLTKEFYLSDPSIKTECDE
jgi:tRNA1Val (adenine37-N6)-methyltransferase